jgi:tRNA(Ile)-lysidine synthase
MYHGRVHPLAQSVLHHIRDHDLLMPGNRVGVAVSGGADSVALLRLLLDLRDELGLVLSVIHLNHNLRAQESAGDEQFVAELAAKFNLPFSSREADVAVRAASNGISLETAARELRYQFFAELLRAQPAGLDRVATGHTLDDQAETVLMRVIRGTGMRGLGGIHPHLELEDQPGEIVRPLLNVRRREIEVYLHDIQQPWREDSTNRDHKFTRNRVRHLLLPLLEREFNPSIAENLSEFATIARAEEDYWESEAAGWMGTAVQWFSPEEMRAASANGLVQLSPTSPSAHSAASEEHDLETAHADHPQHAALNIHWLLSEPLALQRRVIKSIAEEADLAMEFKHVEEILAFAANDHSDGKQLALPLGWKVLREAELLIFEAPDQSRTGPVDYAYRLPAPGQLAVPELRSTIQIRAVTDARQPARYNPDQLFDEALLSRELTVRNWRPGDRFWPAHTKSSKKIKELLQDRHVTGPAKKIWPVIASGNDVVWVRGFAAPAHWQPKASAGRVVVIQEICEE